MAATEVDGRDFIEGGFSGIYYGIAGFLGGLCLTLIAEASGVPGVSGIPIAALLPIFGFGGALLGFFKGMKPG